MNYEQTLQFLYSKLPMFTRVGASAFKKDLHNTILMCERLGNPQHQFKSVHVAGTNGKGSVSHMLAAVFQQAGYKTGLYTSPHLKDFRERIRVNGSLVPKDFAVDFTASQQAVIQEIAPSFFEVTVAMAYAFFAKEKVDIAIIEVGLGGRLDSTNIITPLLSVITNISFDHTNLLGNTLAEIAHEKAGIIKPGVPVVIGETNQETAKVFMEKASQTGSRLVFADQELRVARFEHLPDALKLFIENAAGSTLLKDLILDLNGGYQLRNVLTVLQAVLMMREMDYVLDDAAVTAALAHVKKITGLQGRWQTLGTAPLVICDTGHNVAGIREVVQNIHNTAYKTLHIVFGMVKDKDIGGVLALLPRDAVYYFSQPDLERALPVEMLVLEAAQYGLKGRSYPNIKAALNAAKDNATENDLIFIGGSTFVVAEVL